MEAEGNDLKPNGNESPDPFAREILNQIGVERIDEGVAEGSGPVAVDRAKVKAYLLKQLNDREHKEIQSLTLKYREWYDEFRSVLIELARESDEWDEDDKIAE